MIYLFQKITYYPAILIKHLTMPTSIKKSNIHKTSKISYGCQIYNSRLGKYSYVGEQSKLIHTDVGKFCSISSNVNIGGGSHPVDWISTSPVFLKGRNILRENISSLMYDPYKKTTIGNDVWIGSNVLIKAGVTIGSGAVIGMGSVVTTDVQEYSIVAGSPARLVRKRFNEKIIEQLLESKWWDLSNEKLKGISSTLPTPEEFIEEINKLN